jgi:hypothetical protein
MENKDKYGQICGKAGKGRSGAPSFFPIAKRAGAGVVFFKIYFADSIRVYTFALAFRKAYFLEGEVN